MKIGMLTAGVATLLLTSTLAACSGGDKADDNTLTYWASNQGSSVQNDEQVLTPELKKFTKQTGIKVKLEVVPWADLTPNTVSASVSGRGPDVVNIGNTNAVTFQTTGAFYPFDSSALAKIGGKDRFVPSSWETAGQPGKDPTSIPLYSQVYGLYYNKKIFAAAHLTPPTTWEQLITDAKQLTDPAQKKYGVVIPGGTVNSSMHMAFIFGAQNGGSAFDSSGKPTFTSPGMIKGVQQYVDLVSKYHVVNPSAAQYTDSTQVTNDFATGKAAMYFAQTGTINALKQSGMPASDYGIVPIPRPEGGTKIGSFVAGTNISIFKNTHNLNGSLKLVKFLTSDAEQKILNEKYTTIPPIKGIPATFAASKDQLDIWSQILTQYSKPLPLVAGVQEFQTNVGGAVVKLISQASTGTTITAGDVKSAMEEAQQKMGGN